MVWLLLASGMVGCSLGGGMLMLTRLSSLMTVLPGAVNLWSLYELMLYWQGHCALS